MPTRTTSITVLFLPPLRRTIQYLLERSVAPGGRSVATLTLLTPTLLGTLVCSTLDTRRRPVASLVDRHVSSPG
jgi:hypothetical protein